jgi:hypothetical protein
MPHQTHRSVAALGLLAALLLVPGCESKGRARREAAAAFTQGQRQGFLSAEQARKAVFVRGMVRNPIVAWHPGMTLSQAILAADYTGRQDPRSVVVTRNGVPRYVDVGRLLRGTEDGEVVPGDLIELR